MSPLLLVAALVISFFIFTWLLRAMRGAISLVISTAISLVLFALVLQFLFGIGLSDLWQLLLEAWQGLTAG